LVTRGLFSLLIISVGTDIFHVYCTVGEYVYKYTYELRVLAIYMVTTVISIKVSEEGFSEISVREDRESN